MLNAIEQQRRLAELSYGYDLDCGGYAFELVPKGHPLDATHAVVWDHPDTDYVPWAGREGTGRRAEDLTCPVYAFSVGAWDTAWPAVYVEGRAGEAPWIYFRVGDGGLYETERECTFGEGGTCVPECHRCHGEGHVTSEAGTWALYAVAPELDSERAATGSFYVTGWRGGGVPYDELEGTCLAYLLHEGLPAAAAEAVLDRTAFICDDGGTLCRRCAREPEAIAASMLADDDVGPDHRQWRVVGTQAAADGHYDVCDHCSRSLHPRDGTWFAAAAAVDADSAGEPPAEDLDTALARLHAAAGLPELAKRRRFAVDDTLVSVEAVTIGVRWSACLRGTAGVVDVYRFGALVLSVPWEFTTNTLGASGGRDEAETLALEALSALLADRIDGLVTLTSRAGL